MPGDQEKWDARYRHGSDVQPEAAEVLRQNLHLLPRQGTALDLACGLGGNALLLVQQGLETHAWDLSPVALAALDDHSLEQGLHITTEVRDVIARPPPLHSLDVIVVSRFLHRALMPVLITALKPHGLLYYQTFIRARVHERGPTNPEYLLAPNELLQLCAPLQILVYREEAGVGDISRGFRDEAMLVGIKDR